MSLSIGLSLRNATAGNGIFQINATDTQLRNFSYTCVDDKEEWGPFHEWLVMIGSSILIFTGTVGNVASFFILRQRSYRNNVVSGTLSYLAVLDTVILWTTVLKMFIEGASGKFKDEDTASACMSMIIWAELVSTLDNWLLVIITVSRVIHIRFPFHAFKYCTNFNFYGLIVTQHVLAVASVIPGLITIAKADPNLKCAELLLEQINLAERVAYCMFNFFIPGSTLLFLNGIISQELRVIKARQERLHNRAIPSATASTNTDFKEKSNVNQSSNKFQSLRMSIASASTAAQLTEKSNINQSKNTFNNIIPSAKVPSITLLAEESNVNQSKNTFDSMVPSATVSNITPQATKKSSVNLSNNKLDSMVPSAKIPSITPQATEGSNMNQSNSKSDSVDEKQLDPKPEPRYSNRKSWKAPVQFECSVDVTVTEIHVSRDRDTQSAAATPTGTGTRFPKDTRLQSLTRILFIANCVFLALNLPYWTFHFFFMDNLLQDPSMGCQYVSMLNDLFLLIRWSNHSLNFYFYCATGSRFRGELYSLLSCRFSSSTA